MSDLSESLTVAHLILAKGANERTSEFPALLRSILQRLFKDENIEDINLGEKLGLAWDLNEIWVTFRLIRENFEYERVSFCLVS